MGYKTLLVHLDGSKHCAERVAVAAKLAQEHDAHLVGLAPTGEAALPYWDGSSQATAIIIEVLDALQNNARTAMAAFDRQVAQAGLGRPHEARLDRNDAGIAMIRHARYSDLVIVGQPDPVEVENVAPPQLPVEVLLNAGKPVLMIPKHGHFETVGRRVLVAWDGSREAARAITDAMPFLKRADRVVVLVINPEYGEDGSKHGQEPGADIALFLARHGTKPEVLVKTTHIGITPSILTVASELAADLIVMGGYGHTRLREFVAGGTTRSMLNAMAVPVLMSH